MKHIDDDELRKMGLVFPRPPQHMMLAHGQYLAALVQDVPMTYAWLARLHSEANLVVQTMVTLN